MYVELKDEALAYELRDLYHEIALADATGIEINYKVSVLSIDDDVPVYRITYECFTMT
jgi:hypothetical protein